uniref:Pep_M12B_propep domain-containing protein n=1 Tax=Globodera pallida TaxID=36090 RepID=A0A183CCD2_GLOPA
MHPDGTAADREGERSGGDDAAASRPGPSTSPLLLVFEQQQQQKFKEYTDGKWPLHSSLPLKNSLSKNCRLLKSGPVVLLHCNVNGTKRTAAAAISSSSTVDESAEDQQRRRQPPTPPSSFFGQEPRRRQTKRSTTDQHVRRRLLLITSVISCASLLLFTLITSLIFIRRPFDDATTSTDLNDESGGNDQQLIKKLRGAYSEMSPYSSENAQIWLLNTHEFRRQRRQQRHHDTHGEASDQFLFGLARNCGQFCTVRLKHGVVGKSGGGGQLQQMESLRIRLERPEGGDYRDSNQQQYVDDFRPIVQTMEFDNQTMFRHSHVSSKCFYTARVAEHLEQSVVNLCDRNGGLFGTLALVEGAFVIEPLVDIEQEQEEEMVNGISDEQLQKVGVRKRKRHLTAEFASDLRAHLVYRLQPHHFEDDFHKRTATAAAATETEETKQGTEHHQQLLRASTTTDDHQGFRSAKSVPPWPNRSPPLLTADADHENGTSVPHQRLLQRPTRSANSWEHFVEVLVVADYKMLLYHQHNLENYVLTLFSTVSSIYRHSSLGAAISKKSI